MAQEKEIIIMREEGLKRLSTTKIGKNRPDFLVMHYLIRDLEYAVSKFSSGALLDVGCGNKPYEAMFNGRINSYTGCDVVQSDQQKVDVLCEATALKFDSATFDTVFSTQVIEHVGDPFKMLKEINRVLKDNGTVIISAPFTWELHEEPYDFYRYTKYGLKQMLTANGFEVVEILPNGGKWAALFQLNLNMIYSSFKKKGGIKKLIFTKLGFTTITNKFALWLDRKYYSDLLTLNYVVIAKKVATVNEVK